MYAYIYNIVFIRNSLIFLSVDHLTLQDAYRFISEEDKQKIAAQVENFRTEKSKFDREVAKWDDTGNDVIVLAKQMCMIMMEMTDFTRYNCFIVFFTFFYIYEGKILKS